MTLEFYENLRAACTHQEETTYQKRISPEFVSRSFSVWPLLTSNDLGFIRKSIGFLYSPGRTHKPNMSFTRVWLIKLTCLQGFQCLTSVDLKWPCNSTKNNRVLSPYMNNMYAKFQLCTHLRSPVIVFTRGVTDTQHTHIHTHIHTHTHASVIA